MNDRRVHPYRQPQEPPKPPGDPMRVIVWVAGSLAALIALAAIGLGVSERLATKREEAPVIVNSAPKPPEPVVEATPRVYVEKRPPPRTFPDGPLSFVASAGACFGNCLEHTTLIDDTGHVTLSMRRNHGPICAPKTDVVVSRDDLAALTAHARSIHMETMPESYVNMTDVQRLTTEVRGSAGKSIAIQHLHAEDAGPAMEIDGLHRHIERLAGTEQWMKTCAKTESARNVRGNDLQDLLDTR